MQLNEKIKILREAHQWSQEEMANKMNMSVSGYAKIERGESSLNLHKLEKVAEIFNINMLELISTEGKDVLFLMNKNNGCMNTHNYYGEGHQARELQFQAEIDQLNLIIGHKDELLKEKETQLKQMKDELLRYTELLNLLAPNKND